MGTGEIAGLVLGSGLLSSIATAWFNNRGGPEAKFRTDLLRRIEQLEEHDQSKSARIRDLENENAALRIEVAHLKARLR